MEKKIFTKSENWKEEYTCSIVKIGEVKPIEGSDYLGVTMIEGKSTVVRKDEVKEGDYFIYAENETVLNKDFLSANNLFEIGEYTLNKNAKEVEKMILSGHKEEAKKYCGFFSKKGRVRMIRLRGCPSFGFIFSIDTLANWKPELKSLNLEDYYGEGENKLYFDTILGEEFVKVYVPEIQQPKHKSNVNNAQKKIEKFDRMIPGEFAFHYDTQTLEKNAWRLKPNDVITVTVKKHGTSAIFGNVKVKYPMPLSKKQKALNFIAKKVGLKKPYPEYRVDYGSVYSSRTVIKNQYLNPSVNGGFYDTDLWSEYGERLKKVIPQGMTVYGEIVGYITFSSKMIQTKYDYGCAVGTNYLMPYRIVSETEDGKKIEWNVNEVREWTEMICKTYPGLDYFVKPIEILYHGKIGELYPNLDKTQHWNENVLEAMKNDKRFGMEEIEPLCKNKVPREGICIRIDNDPVAECFKLKCLKYREREEKDIDNGIIDSEMLEGYTEEKETTEN